MSAKIFCSIIILLLIINLKLSSSASFFNVNQDINNNINKDVDDGKQHQQQDDEGGISDVGRQQQNYVHMPKKWLNIIKEAQEKMKPDEEGSEEKNEIIASEEIVPQKEEKSQANLEENKVTLFIHVLMEIFKEVFEDTTSNKDQKVIYSPKITGVVDDSEKKLPETAPSTTSKPIDEESATTPIVTTEIPKISLSEIITRIPATFPSLETTVSTTEESTTVTPPSISSTSFDAPHLSKINNIPQIPTEMITVATTSIENSLPSTPSPTTPLLSFDIQKASAIPTTTPSMISFEVPPPQIPKLSIPTTLPPTTSPTVKSQIPMLSISQLPTKDPPTILPPTTSPTESPIKSPEIQYEDTDENGIPFWLKVIDGIRCSMRDCAGVLVPTQSPYDQKELKNLTMTRFVRNHGLSPCPCIELKELEKVVDKSSSNL